MEMPSSSELHGAMASDHGDSPDGASLADDKSKVEQVIGAGGAGAASVAPAGGFTLESLPFDNLALRSLPIDPDRRNVPRSPVKGAVFSIVAPTPLKSPRRVAVSRSALQLLGLDVDTETARDDFAEYMCGNKVLPGAQPAAHCYCGHQFGYFSGQLGDGATMYLGEVVPREGERWEIQFKGAGKTPYSRTADGRKVLRSSLREFLCSEHMHALGIPTTRAGALTTSDTRIMRDHNYDGHVSHERASVVLRIAPSFIRFGSFEIFKKKDEITGRAGPSVGRLDILDTLLDYVVSTFYPDIEERYPGSGSTRQARNLAFFEEVVRRTARLVAAWQCVGFCHGVLNTDNMSILGLTIDYGPFGFMDHYDPDFVCNGSDNSARYAYKQQPAMCRWNCLKLYEALRPALDDDVDIEEVLSASYDATYAEEYLAIMRRKLGLVHLSEADDSHLVTELFDTMAASGADFTNTFVSLELACPSASDVAETKEGEGVKADACLAAILRNCRTAAELATATKPKMFDPDRIPVEVVEARVEMLLARGMPPQQAEEVKAAIEQARRYVNWRGMTEEEKGAADRERWSRWLKLYGQRLDREAEAARALGLDASESRLSAMRAANPRVVLRNYLAQQAILRAEADDYAEANRLLQSLSQPFGDAATDDAEESVTYTKPPATEDLSLCVT